MTRLLPRLTSGVRQRSAMTPEPLTGRDNVEANDLKRPDGIEVELEMAVFGANLPLIAVLRQPGGVLDDVRC